MYLVVLSPFFFPLFFQLYQSRGPVSAGPPLTPTKTLIVLVRMKYGHHFSRFDANSVKRKYRE